MSEIFVIYMYVLVTGYDGRQSYTRYEMPDIKTCFDAVENSKHIVSNGDENESNISAFCGGKTERNFNATWWKDDEKKIK